MKPKIGIPIPTSRDTAYNQTCWPEYAAAVTVAGGDPVQIPLSEEGIRIAQGCDAFVLPGSPADIDPARYGQAPEPGTAAADPARELTDIRILEHAEATGTPVLAICFGAQILNVWRGGTLVQDLTPIPVNHSAGSQVAVAHSTFLITQSLLSSLLTASEAPPEGPYRRLLINSSHHQAISQAGEDLTVTARCPEDSVIEAVEGLIGKAPVIGVQWHPERSTGISAASRSLFQWLVIAALDHLELGVR